MKLAEVIAQFLEAKGIGHVFGVSGGASLHLIHGIAEASAVKFVPTTHECNAGFAADAYARLTGFGCALATSGPGATNLVTAIATSHYDSVPVLYLTGNVATARASKPLHVRQYGFQDAPIADMVRYIAKAARVLERPEDILFDLDWLTWVAREGRRGPVLLDIPDDLQRAEVHPELLRRHGVPLLNERRHMRDVDRVARYLSAAARPLIVMGAGSRAYSTAIAAFAAEHNIPVVTTWGAIDCVRAAWPYMLGGFGTHGQRGANFAVQNADLLIVLGCRLDTKATGHPPHFAREAKIVMVDLDTAELHKFEQLGRRIDLPLKEDVGAFLKALRSEMQALGDDGPSAKQRLPWLRRCIEWKAKYAAVPAHDWSEPDPYVLMKEIAKWTTPDDIIVADTGTALGYLMQSFPFKGERFLHAFNMTPMGYGLPASIGAAFATGRRVICISGDGSILMSLSELATAARWNLPIKIILLDNGGHAMCRQTERQWFGGRHVGTSIESGLGMPAHWNALAAGFGVAHYETLADLFADRAPGFLRIQIDPQAQLLPQARYGQPLEDADPQLPREEFLSNMIVKPLEAA